jgi:hypothetical protein
MAEEEQEASTKTKIALLAALATVVAAGIGYMGAQVGGTKAARITANHSDARADFVRRLESYRDFASTADNYGLMLLSDIFPDPGDTPLTRAARTREWAVKLNVARAEVAIDGTDEAYVLARRVQDALNEIVARAAAGPTTLRDLDPIKAKYCRAFSEFIQEVRREIGRVELNVDMCSPMLGG